MKPYELKISPGAKRYIKKLKKQRHLQQKFQFAIQDILQDPYHAGTVKTGDLAGIYGYDLYHEGINYEIAYTLKKDEKGHVVLIILAGSRENFYEQLKRYWI